MNLLSLVEIWYGSHHYLWAHNGCKTTSATGLLSQMHASASAALVRHCELEEDLIVIVS